MCEAAPCREMLLEHRPWQPEIQRLQFCYQQFLAKAGGTGPVHYTIVCGCRLRVLSRLVSWSPGSQTTSVPMG